ncbi:hypothetical protein SDC9_163009 [bioreactor metagenome]|uniref:Uncharacterized protein n=1 Tax=bioreactor metagenome TaxID=1076179 RepID=A0A645FMN9_9ZZZZ
MLEIVTHEYRIVAYDEAFIIGDIVIGDDLALKQFGVYGGSDIRHRILAAGCEVGTGNITCKVSPLMSGCKVLNLTTSFQITTYG